MCSDGSGYNIADPGSPPQDCTNIKFTTVRNNSMLKHILVQLQCISINNSSNNSAC